MINESGKIILKENKNQKKREWRERSVQNPFDVNDV